MLSGHGGVSENTNKVVTGNARKLETQGAKKQELLTAHRTVKSHKWTETLPLR